jgi:hypothetical protein
MVSIVDEGVMGSFRVEAVLTKALAPDERGRVKPICMRRAMYRRAGPVRGKADIPAFSRAFFLRLG